MVTVRISAKYFPFIEYAGVAATAVIVGYGGWLSSRGVVEVGVVAAFVLYLQNVFDPINQLSQLYNTVQSAGAAMHKIFGVLDTPGVDQGAAGRGRPRPRRRDRGRPRHVRVRRQRAGAARRVAARSRRASGSRSSARPAPGSRRSPSSSPGSTTRPKARCASAASTCATRRMQSLRDRIVVVPQEGFLFAGSLRDNVRVGRPEATDAEVDDGARGARSARAVPRVPRRPRHGGARARLAAVGRGAPAHLARARRARRSRRCSCSTRRRRTSTPAPSTTSSARWNG